MQKGIVINLLDKEIRDVGTRDEPATPVAWIDQRAIGVCLRPIGQDHGTHDHPVKLAPTEPVRLFKEFGARMVPTLFQDLPT